MVRVDQSGSQETSGSLQARGTSSGSLLAWAILALLGWGEEHVHGVDQTLLEGVKGLTRGQR